MEIDDFLSPESINRVNRQVEELTLDEIVEFSREGIALGRFWAYDLCLATQSATAFMDPKNLGALKATARTGLLAFEAARAVHSAENPTALVVFSREYAVNRSFSSYFELQGRKVFNTHPRGPSFSRFHSFSVSSSHRADNALADNRIAESMSIPVTRKELSLIKEHLAAAISPIESDRRLFFSLPKSHLTSEQIRATLGLSTSAPVVTVLMSSPDEAMATEFGDMYPTSFRKPDDELHLWSILNTARIMPNIQFVFRWHPRGFRKGIPSQDTKRLVEKVFAGSDKMGNVLCNFPSDNLSLFDIAKVTNVALSYRSTAAWDYGALGIPVIQLDQSHDPALLANSKGEIKAEALSLNHRILNALHQPQSIKGATMYLRLYASAFLRLNTPIRSLGRRIYRAEGPIAHVENTPVGKFLATLRSHESLGSFLTYAVGHRWKGSRQPVTQTLVDWENWLKPLGIPNAFLEERAVRRFQREVWKMLGPFDGLESAPSHQVRRHLSRKLENFGACHVGKEA